MVSASAPCCTDGLPLLPPPPPPQEASRPTIIPKKMVRARSISMVTSVMFLRTCSMHCLSLQGERPSKFSTVIRW